MKKMAIRFLAKRQLNLLFTIIPRQHPGFLAFSTFPKPRLLNPLKPPLNSHYRDVLAISSLLQKYGFSPSDLHSFLGKNRFLLNLDTSNIEKSIKIILSLRSSQDCLVSTVFSCPRVLDYGFMKNWENGISKIGISGVTSRAVQNILHISCKYDLYPHDIFRCIECLMALRFSEGTLIKVLEAVPMVIMINEDKIREIVDFLLTIGFKSQEIDSIVGSFPGVLALGVKTRLKLLVDEFNELGFGLDLIYKEVKRDPRVLGLELGELSQCLRMLRSLKCREPIKKDIFKEGEFRAAYEAKVRVDCLHKHGLTYRDAFSVLWKEPRVILYKIEDIERKIDFLLNTMKCDVFCLVEVPQYLGVNFEKQIVPRFNVIEYLRSRGGLGDEVGLRDLIRPSRLKFYNMYVKPYPESEMIYGRFSEDTGAESRHPAGIWKIFKPQHYPESREDVKNIKAFMDSLA